LWQPWALLVALGEKHFETRHWTIKYRGPLVIHAARRWTQAERAFFHEPFYAQALERHGYDADSIPLGCALCMVELKAIYRTEDMRHDITPQERAFGDYSDHRFAWFFSQVQMFAEPIPMKGEQGLFKVQLPDEAVTL
jgi:hypothetical protein